MAQVVDVEDADLESDAPSSHDELYDSALAEGVEDSILEELVNKQGDLTIDDLRRLPGAANYDDESLLKAWKEIESGEGKTATDITAEAFKPSIPMYDEKGVKIEDFSKIGLREILEGKVHFGYNANKAEQRKAFNDIIRVAQLGHHNEQRMAGTIGERNTLAKELETTKGRIAEFENNQKTWDAALIALANGNTAPMQQLAKAYQAELQKLPQATPEGFISRDEVEQQQREMMEGWNFVSNVLQPAAKEIAETYNAKVEEVANLVKWYIEQEGQFLTKEKIDAIIEFDVPNYLVSQGFRAGSKQAPATVAQGDGDDGSELAQMKAQLAAMQETIAKQNNMVVDKAKSRKAPPAGGGATPSGGDSMPAIKNRNEMKDWLRSR